LVAPAWFRFSFCLSPARNQRRDESPARNDPKAQGMTKTKLKQKLENPFALIAQGFVAGAILFWATLPDRSSAQTVDTPVAVTQSING